MPLFLKRAIRIKQMFSFFSSVAQSYLTLWPHGLQHTGLPCPSPTPEVDSNSCPLSRWYHPTISSSVVSSHLESFPASGSFQMNKFFTSGGQSFGVSASASVIPMNIQDWSLESYKSFEHIVLLVDCSFYSLQRLSKHLSFLGQALHLDPCLYGQVG